MQLRIATRKSDLAMWQARHVAEKLQSLATVEHVELVPMTTRGDDILDRSLQKIGGKGLFIKELELAMQAGKADLAVHSMKDVPAEMPDGFCIAAVLERANPHDALVTTHGRGLDSIPQGGSVGSSSLRRQSQLLAIRPDLEIRPLRGNVNTRLAKLKSGEYDAIVLAAAGLERLGMQHEIAQEFAPSQLLPAAAQGVVGIECLEQRADLRELLQLLEDPPSLITTLAERAVARELEASCHSPVASFARIDGDKVHLQALVASVDGQTILRESGSARCEDAQALGISIATRLLDHGADVLLDQ